jgi:Tol biopolymer transport system component
MNADGTGQRDIRLSGLQPIPLESFDEVTHVDGAPYSPDGKRFAYTRSYSPSIGDNIRSEVWVAALDGSEDRMLRRGLLPRWSPNGRLIAYVEPPELSGNIAVRDGGTWLMNPRTGRRVRRIARSSLHVLDWSPHSRWLLYREGPRRAVSVMRWNGAGKRELTSTEDLVDAAFSPNGQRVIFSGTRLLADDAQQHAIWTMTARGTQRRRIFEGPRESDGNVYQAAPSLSWQARPDD